MPREDTTVDHYTALEVPTTATTDEIKKQFRKLALKYHPDRNPGREVEFNAKFQQIQAAHELLTDSVRRKVYDRSRLYHNGINKPKPHPTTSTPPTPSDASASRKYGNSGTTRSGFAPGSRPGDGPFSSKTQREHTPRSYAQAGTTAWKATQNQYSQRPSREVPRTPKKTKDNPYMDPDTDRFPSREPKGHRDDGLGDKTPLRQGFFADRNPREKEWMDPNFESRSTSDSNPRSSGVWENKSSSEEDTIRTSTFYAYTPRTRLRTNLHDKSPEKPIPHNSNQSGNSSRPGHTSTSDTPVSPLRTNVFTRSQTMREGTQSGEQNTGSQHGHDRRRSNSSTGMDGPERRRFSYLFNEDGTRRPHRSSKQTSADSDQDGEDITHSKTRTPLRQSYPSSRRNTLDRDGLAPKSSAEARHGASADRLRSTPYSYTNFDDITTPLSSFKSFESKKPSPVHNAADTAGSRHGKSFSADDWNSVFSGDQNIFAVPPRKGQQSPRKGPSIPKIQTSFNSGPAPPNFSRPRPSATPADNSNTSKDIESDQEQSNSETTESQPSKTTSVPENIQKNAFVFKDWEKAFSETNPFDVTPSQPNGSSSNARSSSRPRKAAGLKKPIGQFTNPKSSSNGSEKERAPSSPTIAQTIPRSRSTNDASTAPISSQPPHSIIADDTSVTAANMPSPIAMDIDTPSGSPIPAPPVPVTPINRKPSTLRQSKSYHSPTVSDEDPVSPIKGDGPPISPLRADELPQRDVEEIINQTRAAPTSASDGFGKPPSQMKSALDMESLRNVEPMAYPPSTGLNGHWHVLEDNLPFESKAAPYVKLSPPKANKQHSSIPKPPVPPTCPANPTSASYDRYCAAMTVYQAHWNEYNGKVVGHIRARLDNDILKCAQNKGFASGTSNDQKTGIQLDLMETQKALDELEEDRQIRVHWEAAIKTHTNTLLQWKVYLEQLEATNDL